MRRGREGFIGCRATPEAVAFACVECDARHRPPDARHPSGAVRRVLLSTALDARHVTRFRLDAVHEPSQAFGEEGARWAGERTRPHSVSFDGSGPMSQFTQPPRPSCDSCAREASG